MDAIRLGRSIRALRVHHRLTQAELAAGAGVSQVLISRIERGGAARTKGAVIDRVALALGARVHVRLEWNGEALDRLLDAGHADLVEQVVGALRTHGWLAEPEATFAIGSERGSVDVLGFHAATGTLLIVEVKSVVPDVQGSLAPFDRKIRLASRIGEPRGWTARRVAALFVIGETRTSRRRIEAHSETFGARAPDRIVAIRRFLARPDLHDPIRGLWFLPFRTRTTARHRASRRLRSG